MSTTTWTSGTPGTGAYAEVNGINLYYETHGAGRPLVLLHGGLSSGEMFGPILRAERAAPGHCPRLAGSRPYR
jgi:pimeloyl-ACP methyl ester carboxylesterase